MHLKGEPAPARYFANGFNLSHPSLSPDGRFPRPADRSRSGLGREMVFRQGDSVMAVGMDLRGGTSGRPVTLKAKSPR